MHTLLHENSFEYDILTLFTVSEADLKLIIFIKGIQ